jgi:alkylation response protein AidB-like acyl-CoA dehydrogenase
VVDSRRMNDAARATAVESGSTSGRPHAAVDESNDTSDLIRASAVDFLLGRCDRARLRGWIARPRPVDRTLWKECAKLGWTGVLLPEALGGAGSSLREALIIAEEAGRHLFAEPLVAAGVMPAVLLAAAASGPVGEIVAGLARTLVQGDRVLCVAWQEVAGRLDEESPACELRDGRITGVKRFVVGCEGDSIALVWAASRGEPVLLAVDVADAGVDRDPQSAGLGTYCELRFDRARVLFDMPLLTGDAATRALKATVTTGRLALAAELSGLAAGCLAQTLAHVRTRKQFERFLGSFQAVQHRCVNLHIETELAGASWREALERVETLERRERAERLETLEDDTLSAERLPVEKLFAETDASICAAKARAGETAVRVGRESLQLHGAMGFCDDVDIGLYLRAALQGSAFLGGSVALRRRFAQWFGGDGVAPEQAVHV